MALDRRLEMMKSWIPRYGWHGFFERTEGLDLIEVAHVHNSVYDGPGLTGGVLDAFTSKKGKKK